MRVLSVRFFFVIYFLASSLDISLVDAQSIQLTEPLSARTVKEGDDYASIELGNPWDFEQARDSGFEVGFQGASVGVQGGIWRAANELSGGYFFPLFGGYKGLAAAEGPQGDKQLPRFGINHPIDASRYRVLSMHLNHTARTAFALHWNSDPSQTLWPTGKEFGSSYDGIFGAIASPRSGFTVYTYDMPQRPFEQHAGSWQGLIYALRIDPSVAGGPGSVTEVDWIRLVDPDSAPELTISWNSQALPPLSVITVWVDVDGGGYNGSPIAHYLHGGGVTQRPGHYSSHPRLQQDTGVHRFSTAVLPPGTYHFYVTVSVQHPGGLAEISRSNYSAALRVQSAPQAYFTSPSPLSGEDYATVSHGNPWDMDGPTDIVNLPASGLPQILRQFSFDSFVNGVFQALADQPIWAIGNVHTDAQVHLNVPAHRPVQTSRYRYLNYRIAADPTLYPTISDKVANGWVTRAVFWNSDIIADGGSTKAHVLYEGAHTYTLDLWDPATWEAGIPWLGFRHLAHLRIDPLETSIPTWFFLDWVTLTSENYPQQDRYRLSWVVEDPDNSSLTMSLYYDRDPNGYDGTLIAKLPGRKPGAHSFLWNTSQLSAGRYFPYLVVEDGSDRRAMYAAAPVVVGNPPPQVERAAPFDFDGDGFSDRSVYRGASGGIYYVATAKGALTARQWGGFGYYPVDGDFDGDLRSDHAVLLDWFGTYYWYVLLSSNGGLYMRQWGVSGDLPVVADYNGDGISEIAVFRQGLWYVLYASGAVQVAGWGEPGDWPLPADYDGDGAADFAIWRPWNGTWWILNSSYSAGSSSPQYRTEQWGLFGDYPVPGDFDGDGRLDLAVWRSANGVWYLKLASGRAEAWQWGLPGDVPVVGSFLRQGLDAFTVWRPSSGIWYHADRSGSSAAAQWGLPGDAIPNRAG